MGAICSWGNQIEQSYRNKYNNIRYEKRIEVTRLSLVRLFEIGNILTNLGPVYVHAGHVRFETHQHEQNLYAQASAKSPSNISPMQCFGILQYLLN